MVIRCASNIGFIIPARGEEGGEEEEKNRGWFFLGGTTDWSFKCAISPRDSLVWRVSGIRSLRWICMPMKRELSLLQGGGGKKRKYRLSNGWIRIEIRLYIPGHWNILFHISFSSVDFYSRSSLFPFSFWWTFFVFSRVIHFFARRTRKKERKPLD